jgi:RNA:NAD 2'-phosphotransferase (TPT1/KptA family)
MGIRHFGNYQGTPQYRDRNVFSQNTRFRVTPMKDSRLVKISKYLSKHLRHQPERIGLKLAPGGWVCVGELLAACTKHQFHINRAELLPHL